MNELISKKVKIVFLHSQDCKSGILGTVCTILGFQDGFLIVNDYLGNISYYSLNSIKSITILSEKSRKAV